MAATPLSPQASPRLPSPPPIPEDQVGPTSPSPTIATPGGLLDATINLDNGALRRIRPGAKSADMHEGPPLIDISEIDTAYQLTEHLKALYNAETNPASLETTIAVDRDIAIRLATPPKDIDRAIWLYELCRFLCQKVNSIIIALFADEPPCSAQTCNEMRASEWQYLCAVHDPPKPCCAIDYCCHTLDWAANVLTSQKHFPSRMTLGTEQGASHQQMRQLTNIFRRVYRIFAHAWFQHREMFWKVETRTGLYMFFKTVCDVYSLIPEDNYTIPPEAEGKVPENSRQHQSIDELPSLASISIASRKDDAQTNNIPTGLAIGSLPHILPSGSQINTGHTTKRHRQTPSMDAGAISTVVEESEEDDGKSVAGSVITTIEDIGADGSQTAGTKTAPVSLGEAVSSAPSASSTTKDIPSSEKASAPEERSDLQSSVAAMKAMDEAIELAESADQDSVMSIKEDPETQAAPSSAETLTTSLKDITPSIDITQEGSDSQPEAKAKHIPEVSELTATSTPAKGESPRLKSEEPKSKIPVAKKDTPVKSADKKSKDDAGTAPEST